MRFGAIVIGKRVTSQVQYGPKMYFYLTVIHQRLVQQPTSPPRQNQNQPQTPRQCPPTVHPRSNPAPSSHRTVCSLLELIPQSIRVIMTLRWNSRETHGNETLVCRAVFVLQQLSSSRSWDVNSHLAAPETN